MKAIQIRYLPATNFKGTRLKVWAEGVKAMIFSRDYSYEHETQARLAAQEFIDKMGWNKGWNTTGIMGFGCLPNGDYVATLGE